MRIWWLLPWPLIFRPKESKKEPEPSCLLLLLTPILPPCQAGAGCGSAAASSLPPAPPQDICPLRASTQHPLCKYVAMPTTRQACFRLWGHRVNKSAQTPNYMEFSLLGRPTRKKCIEQDRVGPMAIIKAMEKNKGGACRWVLGKVRESLTEKRTFHQNPGGGEGAATWVPGDEHSSRGNSKGKSPAGGQCDCRRGKTG